MTTATELTDDAAPAQPAGPVFDGPPFHSTGRYQLDPAVALRPEPFGALAYHYGSRRLTFLRSPLLADLVRRLGQHPSVDAALAAEVPAAQHPSYRRALASLAASGFIRAG